LLVVSLSEYGGPRRSTSALSTGRTSEDVKKHLIDVGGDPIASTPAGYARNIQREEGKWLAVIKKLGLVVN
jgi:hypothetical protein